MATRKFLNDKEYFLRSNNTNNPYLNIHGLDSITGSGFHSFYIVGSRFLRKGSHINFEIVDSKGNAVEIAGVRSIRKGNARIISFSIDDDVANGGATLFVSATLNKFLDENNFPIAVPGEWNDKPNLLFSYNFTIDKDRTNSDDIIFRKRPKVDINPVVKEVERVNKETITVSTGSGGSALTGSVIEFEQISESDYLVTFEANENPFIGAMRNGDIRFINRKYEDDAGNTKTFSYVSNSLNPTDNGFEGTINKLRSSKTLEAIFVNPDLNVFGPGGNISFESTFIPKGQDYTFEVDYTTNAVSIESLAQTGTYADIILKDLQTVSGDVEVIKIFTKSDSEGTNYSLLFEGNIDEQDSLLEVANNLNIGTFDSSSKLTQWTVSDATNAGDTPTDPTPEFLLSEDLLLNGAVISGSNDVFTKNIDGKILQKPLYSLESNTSFTLYRDVDYDISLNAAVENVTTADTRLDVYISGSNLPKGCSNRFGTLIHSFRTDTDRKWFDDDTKIRFNRENTIRDARIIFVVTSGKWHISDVEIVPDLLEGFTPGEYRAFVPLNVLKVDQDFDFKIEFYDGAGTKASTVIYKDNIKFDPANLIVDGDGNVITGKLWFGDSSGSGVFGAGTDAGGYIASSGYEGFTSASEGLGPAGFLLFSGSVLPDSGDNYQGVGMESAQPNSWFKFRTNPSELDIRTDKFFFGDPGTQYISGSDGQLEISSSNFFVNPASGELFVSGTIVAPDGFIGGWDIEEDKISSLTGTPPSQSGFILSSSAQGGRIVMLNSGSIRLTIASDGELPAITTGSGGPAPFSDTSPDEQLGTAVNTNPAGANFSDTDETDPISGFDDQQHIIVGFDVTGSINNQTAMVHQISYTITLQGSGSAQSGWQNISSVNKVSGVNFQEHRVFDEPVVGYDQLRLFINLGAYLQQGESADLFVENIEWEQLDANATGIGRLIINKNGIFQALSDGTYLTLGSGGGGGSSTAQVTSVHGRLGDVTGQSGDYTAAQVDAVSKANGGAFSGSLEISSSNPLTINGQSIFNIGFEQNLSENANVIFNQARINDYLNISGSGRIQAADTGSVELVAGDGTNNGIFRSDRIIVNTLDVTGQINNTTTNQLLVQDQYIALISGSTGTPTLDGGLYIERGGSSDAYWFWDEGNDQWGQKLGLGGTFDRAIFASEIFPNGGSQALGSVDDVTFNNITGSNLQINNGVTINGTLLFNLNEEQNLSTSSNVEFGNISGSSLDISGRSDLLGFVKAPNASITGSFFTEESYLGGWFVTTSSIESHTSGNGLQLLSNGGTGEVLVESASKDIMRITSDDTLPAVTSADRLFFQTSSDFSATTPTASGGDIGTVFSASAVSDTASGFAENKTTIVDFDVTASIDGESGDKTVAFYEVSLQGGISGSFEEIRRVRGDDIQTPISYEIPINNIGYDSLRLSGSIQSVLDAGETARIDVTNVSWSQYTNKTFQNQDGFFQAIAPGLYLSLASGIIGESEGGGLSSPVTSVFGRAGNVEAQTGDYSAAQVDAVSKTNGGAFSGSIFISGSSEVTGSLSVTDDFILKNSLLSNQENPDVDTGVETVASITASYDGAFFDYVIKSGSNLRAGTVYAVHDGTNVEFTEVSTNDLGVTSDVSLAVDLSASNLRLRASSSSDNWDIKSLVRGL